LTPALADTSFLVAVFNKREAAHKRCLQAYREVQGPLLTCEACIAEALRLLQHAKPAADAVLGNIQQGALQVPFRLSDSAAEVRTIMLKYADTPGDFADACLIRLADQAGTGDILTFDSDFKHYRWRRNRHFRLLIPLE
jgi:predicted nucleic acid-binding protein